MVRKIDSRQFLANLVFFIPPWALGGLVISHLLSIVYLLPLVWSVLFLSTWEYVVLLNDYVKSRLATFLALYLSVGSVISLIFILQLISSFSEKVILVLVFVTVIAYCIPVGITILAGKKELQKEAFPDEVLSQRLKELVSGRHHAIPEVCIMPAPIAGKAPVYAEDVMGKRILITRQITEALSQEEMDAVLAHEYYLTKSHGSVKNLFLIFTPIIADADVFLYFMMGGLPSIGIIVVPISAVTLLFCIFLFPLIVLRFQHLPVRAADRFAIKTTGNSRVLLSAIEKITEIQGAPSFTEGRLAQRILKSSEKSHRKRLARIERMRF